MPKRYVERIVEQVQKLAQRLSDCEEKLETPQLTNQLRASGIDPDALKSRFYEAAKAIAEREQIAGRVPPLGLQQAIEQTAPEDIIPASQKAADKKMERWLDRFGQALAPQTDLTVARAYRKSDELASEDQAELDELADRLKETIKKEIDEGEI